MTLHTLVALGLCGASLAQEPSPKATPPSEQTPSREAPSKVPAGPSPSKKTASNECPVSFPHPLISEIMYAVPSGDEGDANQDGTRHATGDEFVEIFNPHGRSINLKGYALHDRSKGKKGSMQFIFPDCDLRPGQVAVVFNGYQANITGPVGDSQAAPKEPSKKFHMALVFTMKNAKESIGLANAGDCVVLCAPDGTHVQVVRWGKFTDKPIDSKLIEEAPTASKCSVQRRGLTGMFAAHADIDGLPSSPGRFDAGGSSPAKPEKPARDEDSHEKPAPKPEATKPAEDVKPKPKK